MFVQKSSTGGKKLIVLYNTADNLVALCYCSASVYSYFVHTVRTGVSLENKLAEAKGNYVRYDTILNQLLATDEVFPYCTDGIKYLIYCTRSGFLY